MFIISLIKIVQRINQSDLDHILSHVPYILLLSCVTLYLILIPHMSKSLPTKNSLGLLAGATLISGLSIKKINYKIIVSIIAIFIVIKSESRSSLAYSLGLSVIYLLYNVNFKSSPIIILGVITVLFFQNNLYTFFEDIMVKKELKAKNLNEALDSAQSERQLLLEKGWALFKERPFWGFGLKTKYYEGRIYLRSKQSSVHVHNGYLGTLLETGLIVSFFTLLFIIYSFIRIFELFFLRSNSKENIWLFFLLFGFLRAYGENYLFFNIGNIFSIIFIFFNVILFFNKKNISLTPVLR